MKSNMGMVRRHPNRAIPIALAALAVVCWMVASGLALRRRAEDQRIAQVANRAHAELEEGLGELLRGLTGEARRAAELPPLRAALEHEVDTETFRDLLSSEDWWAPWRERVALVVGPQGRLLESGPRARLLLEQKLVAEARDRQPAAAWIGSDELLAAAAVPVPGPRRGAPSPPSVLVLGRPLDQALLGSLASRGGLSLLVSDGRRPGLFAGPASKRKLLAGLVGGEDDGLRLDSLGRWVAVPLTVQPGRWIWALRDLSDRPATATWLTSGLLALAALTAGAAGLFWLRGSRHRPREESERLGHEVPAALIGPGLGAGESRPPAGVDQPTQILSGQAQVFGRYTLIERIGEGGMSELFTAVLTGAEGFHRLYVVKRLKPDVARNKAAVDQFIDEAKLGSRLVHSNIVPVFDFGKVGSGYFLAQEYIAGRNLGQIVERHEERLGEPLGMRLVFYLAHEVLEALAYAHTRVNDEGQALNIVHRDVSSWNVMVTVEGEVKLFDFGIVSASDRVSSTEVGRVKGNASFMSPEQARGQPVDARSDLFSLGIVMYFALTGESLYDSKNPAAAFYQATAGLNADHLARIRALPPPIPAILEKALAMDPASRYTSARDFAETLAPYAAGMKTEMATLMNALFGEDLRRQTASFRAKLGLTLESVQRSQTPSP
jgi:hypothetical protein